MSSPTMRRDDRPRARLRSPAPARARRARPPRRCGEAGRRARRPPHPRRPRRARRARGLRRSPRARHHLVRQPPLPRVHPRRTDEGLAAVRHGRVVGIAVGHLVARSGRRDPCREPRRSASSPTWPACPASAGGVFVSGVRPATCPRSSSRATPPRRAGGATPAPRSRCTTETHSSVSNTMRIIDVEPLLVPTVDDRMTGDALAAALAADGDAPSLCAVSTTAGTTNAGIVDDLAGVARVSPGARHLDARRRRLRRRRALRAECPARGSPGSSTPTRW